MKNRQQRRRAAVRERTPEEQAARKRKPDAPIVPLDVRLYEAYRLEFHKRDGVKNMLPYEQTPPHVKKYWRAVMGEAMNYSRAVMVKTIRDLIAANVGDAVADAKGDVETGSIARTEKRKVFLDGKHIGFFLRFDGLNTIVLTPKGEESYPTSTPELGIELENEVKTVAIIETPPLVKP